MGQVSFREQLRRELPRLLREDKELQAALIQVLQPYFATREEVEGRFDPLLREFRAFTEHFLSRWEVESRAWLLRWEELRNGQEQLWREVKELREGQERLNTEVQGLKAEVQELREAQEELRKAQEQFGQQLQQVSQHLIHRFDATIGALGARWGVASEAAFRNGVIGILREFLPNIQVRRVVEKDETGEVFGHASQVELDIIITDGLFLIGEIKSSISVGDVSIFLRKVRFYEKRHNVQAQRLVMISPMVDPKALELAENLGIVIYTHAVDAGEGLLSFSSSKTS